MYGEKVVSTSKKKLQLKNLSIFPKQIITWSRDFLMFFI